MRARLTTALSITLLMAAMFANVPIVCAQRAPASRQQAARAPFRITWLGHAGFELVSARGTRVLIDPWIEGNDKVPAAYRDSARYAAPATRPQVILVTHAHGDHDGDALKLARWSGASVVATGDHLQAMTF